MKAVLGWAMHDLLTASRLLASKPPGYWDQPNRQATRECLERTVAEACGFLKEVGSLRNPVRDSYGNQFWYRRGRLVRWEPAGEEAK